MSPLPSVLAMIQEIAAKTSPLTTCRIISQDEIGNAGLALNKMKNNLRELIQSIAGTAERVASASEEISSNATEQAQGADTPKRPNPSGGHRNAGNVGHGDAGFGEFQSCRRCRPPGRRHRPPGWLDRRSDADPHARHRRNRRRHRVEGPGTGQKFRSDRRNHRRD